jgi:hypothetical protein
LLIGYLQDISAANGYLTEMGLDISHWSTQIVPRDKTSRMWANLKDETNEHETGHTETLAITVELGCKTTSNYTIISDMIQDVQKCFEDNLASLCNSMNDDVMRWIPVSETIDVMRESDAEFGTGKVVMNLVHKVDEKWRLDETVY